MTPNIKGTDSSISSAHLVPYPVLYFPNVVHSTRKQHTYLGFSKGTPSSSFFFSIAGNIHQFKLL